MSLIKNMMQLIILSFIYSYRIFISPFTPHSCRFLPTCSAYAAEAFKTKPIHTAFYLSFKRILKCNPWGPSGFDPVPEKPCNKKAKQAILNQPLKKR